MAWFAKIFKAAGYIQDMIDVIQDLLQEQEQLETVIVEQQETIESLRNELEVHVSAPPPQENSSSADVEAEEADSEYVPDSAETDNGGPESPETADETESQGPVVETGSENAPGECKPDSLEADNSEPESMETTDETRTEGPAGEEEEENGPDPGDMASQSEDQEDR